MYQVLARKWRPQTFSSMVGQEHILRILSNALEQNRVHHAYLFTGTRGVGKTTLARIIAKCLNCELTVSPNPCGQCPSCQAIDKGQFLDLYEVDAASRTKVEDTRELLENVMYPPSQGRFKIYLIDEVHMLSTHSFNALLKTLEEPPEHVKFLLATTDPKKLPITVLSRCLQFHLKRIPNDKICEHLQHICQQETIHGEKEALMNLAKAADGSMRDALSLLDQAIAYGNGQVLQDDVNQMLGSITQTDLLPLLTAIAKQDGPSLFEALKELAERVPDFQQILQELTHTFHQIAIEQMIPHTMDPEKKLQDLVTMFSPEAVQLYYQIALLGRRDLNLAPSPQQGFEMTMLRMLSFRPALSLEEKTPPHKQKDPVVANQNIQQPAAKAVHAASAHDQIDWRETLAKLGLSGMAYALASNCTLEQATQERVVLTLSANHQPMLNEKLRQRIEESLSHYLKRTIQLQINITTQELYTPTKQEQHEQQKKLHEARERTMHDPKIKKIIEMYDATVEVNLA